MNEKYNKLITICLLFSFFLFNVFTILPIVEVVSANEIEIDDSTIFGTLINASQGGRGGKGLKTGNRALGDSLSRDNRGGGQRLGNAPDRYGFNPSLVDIDLIYNDYTTFINNYYTNDEYIVPLHKTYFYYSSSAIRNTGFTIRHPNTINPPIDNSIAIDVINIPKSYRYMYMVSDEMQGFRHHTYSNSNNDWTYNGRSRTYGFDRFQLTRYSGNAFEAWYYSGRENLHVEYLIFTDSSILTNDFDIIHRTSNLPTKQEFINNYTNTFNVEYDTTTNQLVKNDNIISYNINDFSDDSITINNDYVTNNYEIHIGDNIVNPPSDSKDYTTILDSILNAIKELPQKIADLMPEPIYEAGTNIWDFLTDSLDNILDFLETLLMGILNLIFPTAEQLEESKGLLDNLFSTFSEKTEFITAPIQSFSSIYGTSRPAMFSSRDVSTNNNSTNLYNRTMVINDTELHILPASLEPAISAFRMVSTGVVVILTIISIYTRFRGVVKN